MDLLVLCLFHLFFTMFHAAPSRELLQDALSSQNLQVRELREAKMRQEELKREAQEQRSEWYKLYIYIYMLLLVCLTPQHSVRVRYFLKGTDMIFCLNHTCREFDGSKLPRTRCQQQLTRWQRQTVPWHSLSFFHKTAFAGCDWLFFVFLGTVTFFDSPSSA